MQIQLHKLLSIEACYAILREIRWEQGVFCPFGLPFCISCLFM
jgi:hypothetical protein